MISIKSLNKYFNKGKQNEIHVINNVDLELPERGMVAVFGKSGCGKTTLLNVIGGLDGFDGGAVSIDGENIRKNTDNLRNRYIGYIFQNYNLNNSETCYENIANALYLCGIRDEKIINERVGAALTNVGMEKYAKRTPDTLSGGQQQRIAIARAIVKNPRIILADEPTGNLDEANTVMIMDLLREIAKDHLVILVTHEENLVDHYCDSVIELSDGSVKEIKTNESANGLLVKSKNDIYLGELDKTQSSDKNCDIEYYGDSPDEPIKLKIVNSNGKFYIKVETEGVALLDRTSEIRLKEGVFIPADGSEHSENSFDMTSLPPVEAAVCGRLFKFSSSVKSGYRSNFKTSSKGKKTLRTCLALFAAIIVFMSAIFGTFIGTVINARSSYNHNVFYLLLEDEGTFDIISDAIQRGEGGIDFTQLYYGTVYGDEYVRFRVGSFETFSTDDFYERFSTHAVILPQSLVKDKKTVAGRTDSIEEDGMIITTTVADSLIETSALGHISEYADLIGLICDTVSVDGRKAHIEGIVDSEESSIYLNDLAMAKYIREKYYSEHYLASEYGYEVRDGETTLILNGSMSAEGELKPPSVGSVVKINGIELTVSAVKKYYSSYAEWIEAKYGEDYASINDCIRSELRKERPDLDEESTEFADLFNTAYEERLFEYTENYYSELDNYLTEYYSFNKSDMNLWLYKEKAVDAAKYRFLDYEIAESFYRANIFKEMQGRYPTLTEIGSWAGALSFSLEAEIGKYERMYSEEYYQRPSHAPDLSSAYLLSDADFIKTTRQYGSTHITHEAGQVYAVIHSKDPEATSDWLEAKFPELASDLSTDIYSDKLITPDKLYERITAGSTEEIAISVTAFVVILVTMCICMYFIMRSSLLARIKEVGIYRAIGVSKKNLVFKFLIEAAVLFVLTVFIGFILSSAFIWVCLGISPLVENIFFYPLWMGAAVLALLLAIDLFFGILPIVTLLRKTPSEILAKYDI